MMRGQVAAETAGPPVIKYCIYMRFHIFAYIYLLTLILDKH